MVTTVVRTRAVGKPAASEAWIGRDGRTRALHLSLLVRNHRVLILSEVRQTNLASWVFGPVMTALPEHWQQHAGARRGYAIVLGRSTIDPTKNR